MTSCPAQRRRLRRGEGRDASVARTSGRRGWELLLRYEDEASSFALLEVVPKCTLNLLGDVGRDGAPTTSRAVAGRLPWLATKFGRHTPRHRNAEAVLITVLASEDHRRVMG